METMNVYLHKECIKPTKILMHCFPQNKKMKTEIAVSTLNICIIFCTGVLIELTGKIPETGKYDCVCMRCEV